MSNETIARRYDVASNDAIDQRLSPEQRALASSEQHDALREIKARERHGGVKIRTRVPRLF